ncbi:MAG TPA: CHASE sensor domain-containing protein [Terriglobales bacterium]|nr:CHASE sensor domain-containing protein [Terriglobales bacterium]
MSSLFKFGDYSIAKKLTAMNLLVSAAALLLACMAFLSYDLYTFRVNIVRNLSIQSEIIGANTISALVFNDPQSAENTLAALKASPHIFYAEIYDSEDHPFAGYGRDHGRKALPLPQLAESQERAHWFDRDQVSVIHSILFQNKRIGTVFIQSDLKSMTTRLKSYALIILGILSGSLLAALMVSHKFQKIISDPVMSLAETARIVSREKNYSVRAAATGNHDEVSTLIEAFNGMLVQIQERDKALQRAHDELEGRIEKRTAELGIAQENLRALSGRLLRMRDDERRHIARELHDGSGQVLAALTMNLSIMQGEAEKWGPKALKLVNDSLELARTILKDLRTMSYLLHPPLLDEIGLESALRWFVHGFSERSGIPVDLQLVPEAGRLSRELETAIFRIVQESLTNIHRHSGSLKAAIQITRDPKQVRLEISDKGSGFSQPDNQVKTGVGIQGMRERVRQLGGEFEIRSDIKGTAVIAVLPLQQGDSQDEVAGSNPLFRQ